MPVQLAELTAFLDGYLRIAEVPDWPNAMNGLQVQNGGTVERLAAAVDACQTTIQKAADLDAQLLLVHHGLFWGGLQPITGRYWERVRALVRSDLAVYSAHLPLDVHPDVGNNAVLAGMLGLHDQQRFGEYRGELVGVVGDLELSLEDLANTLRDKLGVTPHVIDTGPGHVRRVAIVTGGGGGMIRDAVDAGADCFISGEGAHHTYFDAEEWKINVIYAGHYATETVGVKALATVLSERFQLPWEFIDHPTGL